MMMQKISTHRKQLYKYISVFDWKLYRSLNTSICLLQNASARLSNGVLMLGAIGGLKQLSW